MENIFCPNNFSEDYQGGDDMGGGEFDSGKFLFDITLSTKWRAMLKENWKFQQCIMQLFYGKCRTAEQPNRAGTCIEMLADPIKEVLFGCETESTRPIHQSSWSELYLEGVFDDIQVTYMIYPFFWF